MTITRAVTAVTAVSEKRRRNCGICWKTANGEVWSRKYPGKFLNSVVAEEKWAVGGGKACPICPDVTVHLAYTQITISV